MLLLLVIAALAYWWITSPESEEAVAQRHQNEMEERGAVLNPVYLMNDPWCDSRGGKVRFFSPDVVLFFRSREDTNEMSRGSWRLDGDRLTLSQANGRAIVATVTRVAWNEMTMSIPGRPVETVRHCAATG